MNKQAVLFWLKLAAGGVGLAGVIAWAGGAFHSKLAPGQSMGSGAAALVPSTATITVISKPYAPRVDVVGTVASETLVHLSARIPASVKDVFVSAGSVVTAGHCLITLDDREIREQLTAAQAQLKQAETEYQRAKQLFDNKAATDQALVAAESMFHSSRAQADRVKVMLSYAQIVSPIDGIVTDRRVESGDLANPGQVLLTVYDPAHMRLEAPVPMRLIERLALNQVVDVTLDRPERPFNGRVTHIVGEIDPRSRTQWVKVQLDGVKNDVLPGTFGRLWLTDLEQPMIRIPESAVYRVGQLELVQVIQDRRPVRRLVKTGAHAAGQIEILSGLSAGDVLVAHPTKEN